VILQAGTFNVNDYRKNIPAGVKLQVLLNWVRAKLPYISAPAIGCPLIPDDIVPSWFAKDIEFDHYPALTNRDYDTDAGDFIPPQHDPNHIVPLRKQIHLQKTTGRAPGAERTVTTRGSDVGERSRTQDLRANDAVMRARLALKAGREDEAKEILATARLKKKHTRPKRKIAARPNAWPSGRKLGGTKHESRHGRDPKSGSANAT
jgi:hypothetical protein